MVWPGAPEGTPYDMADEVVADYASMRAAADAIERIPADCGVTSFWLDYDGDFGHEGLQAEASSFVGRWQGGGRDLERAHVGIATDVRQSAAGMELVDGLVEKTHDFFAGLLGGDD